MLVIGLKDESSMRAFAPAYWETRGAVKPATLWASGPDQYYLALRTDVEIDTRLTINPYMAAYASYVSLILRQSSPRDLPLWFSQGFTGVLSNTIVRDDDVLVGAPIPFYLEVLRDRPILPLANASSRPLPATAAGSVAAPAAVSQACRGGNSEACATLLPVADRACGGGNGQACVFVGSLYERGLGVAADPARAAALYRQACDKDDARGCLAGAMLQARGAGVPKDVAAADATLTRLCDAAVMDACTQLAMLVAPGGTPANLARARTLLTKACDARAPRACELLSSLPSR